eukprot:14116592-Ditylum_brightwellii.AAC.1
MVWYIPKCHCHGRSNKTVTTNIHPITTAASTTATSTTNTSKPTTKAQNTCLQRVNNQPLMTNTCFAKACLRRHFQCHQPPKLQQPPHPTQP